MARRQIRSNRHGPGLARTWLFARLSAALGLALLVSGPAGAQTVSRDFTTRVIQSGHSLTDPIPPMLERLVAAGGGGRVTIARSTIPGSTMDWRWAHDTTPLPNARTQIADYDLLVLTERVSLSGTMPWHNSDREALRWVENAWKNGRGGDGAETMLYATWVQITSGPDYDNPYKDVEGHIPFRQRMPLEWARWEAIERYVNLHRPQGMPKVQMIPGPLLFAELYDAIEAGKAPGVTDISALFLDDIHINDLGAYYVSLAHYAMIYGRDPRGLPADVGQDNPPSPELANFMQDTVWRVLTGYSGSGLTD